MLVYNLNLALVYIGSIISRISKTRGNKIISNIINCIVFSSMWMVSGLRYNVGTDYELYSHYFNNIYKVTAETSIMEVGYMWLNKIVNYFSNSNQVIFVVTSFIIIYLIFNTVLKYSKRYELSLYLFITMYFYYASFNITRQYISIAITFYALRFLVNNNFKKYAVSIIIASLFHNSALIMIPFYFILKMGLDKKIYFGLTIVSIIGFFSINKIINLVFAIIPRYKKYMTSDFLTSESNWMHFLVILVLVIVCILIKDKLLYNDKKNKIYLNAVIFAAIFQLLGIKTVLFSRIVMYLYIYAILLIPNTLSVFNIKLRPILYLIIMIVYYMNCIVLFKTGNSGVLPYLYRWI